MRSNVCLLEFFINYWDNDLGAFDLQGEILEIALEYIYFIVGCHDGEFLSTWKVLERVVTF